MSYLCISNTILPLNKSKKRSPLCKELQEVSRQIYNSHTTTATMALVVSLVKPLIRDHNLSRPTKSNSSSPNSIMIMLPVSTLWEIEVFKMWQEKGGKAEIKKESKICLFWDWFCPQHTIQYIIVDVIWWQYAGNETFASCLYIFFVYIKKKTPIFVIPISSSLLATTSPCSFVAYSILPCIDKSRRR